MDTKQNATESPITVWVSLSTIFISGLYVATPIGIFFFGYALMAVVFAIMVKKTRSFGLKKDFFYFFIALLFTSCISTIITNGNYGNLLYRISNSTAKIILLAFFVAFFYLTYKLSGKSTQILFNRYLQVATFFSWIGILQQIVFLITKHDILSALTDGAKNYGSFLGIAGLSVEPAFFSCALLPAATYHASNFIKKLTININACVVITALVFSTSSLGYIGIILSIFLSFFIGISLKRFYITLLTIPIALALVYQLTSTEFFQLRFKDTMSVIGGAELTMGEGMNISTYSAAVNAVIAARSFTDNKGFGSGFGTYSSVFDKYIHDFEMPTYRDELPGRGSATSLLSRSTAEMGIFAWLFLLLTIFHCWKITNNTKYTSMGIAYLSTIVIVLLRMGEYYANGVILVFLMIHWMKLEISPLKTKGYRLKQNQK